MLAAVDPNSAARRRSRIAGGFPLLSAPANHGTADARAHHHNLGAQRAPQARSRYFRYGIGGPH